MPGPEDQLQTETTNSSAAVDTASAAPATNAAETTAAPEAKDAATDDTTALGKKPDAEADADPAKATETPGDKPIIGAPEGDYEVTAPEGREFDKETFEAVAPILKEMDLSNEGAQRIVNAYAEKVLPIIEKRFADQYGQQQQLQTAEYRKQWLDDAKADPEIGGAKWDESMHLAGKVFDAVGMKASDPLRVLLEESGLGNHPDFIRYQRRVAQLIGEDKTERGEGHVEVKKTAEGTLYSAEFQPKN